MKRDELLKELNELIHDYPGNYPSEIRKALKDAREYLNPEPKILTVEELRQLPAQTIVWIDYWDGEEKKLGTMMAGMKCYEGTLVDEEASVYNDFEKDMTPDRFDGSRWRFWSGKPTEEQRKAVPWQ